MIASRRGLYVLAALAAALAVGLVVDLRRSRDPIDHALIPGFAEAPVTSLTWAGSPTEPSLRVERVSADAPWRRTSPTPGEVEPRVIADVLATLRGARWQRTAKRVERGLGLTIARGSAPPLVVIIGERAPTAEQAWISINDHAYLVDAWIVRALRPDPLDVSIRHPLTAIPDAETYTLNDATIANHPRRLYPATQQIRSPRNSQLDGVVLDPAVVEEISRTIANLEIAALSTRPLTLAPDGVRIAGAGTEAVLGGACNDDPTLVALVAPSGGGCVRAHDASAVTALIKRLHGPPSDIAAKQPVPFAPLTIKLADGGILDLTKRPRIDNRDADAAAVSELLAALSLPAATVRVPTSEDLASYPVQKRFDHAAQLMVTDDAFKGPRIVVTRNDVSLELQLDPKHRTVKRKGDLVVLALAEGAFATLIRAAGDYVDRTLWIEDPLTITEIEVGLDHFTRGGVVGEWKDAKDSASVERVAVLAANPKVVSYTLRPTGPALNGSVVITVVEPTGAQRRHELLLFYRTGLCVGWTSRAGAPGNQVFVDLDSSFCAAVRAAR